MEVQVWRQLEMSAHPESLEQMPVPPVQQFNGSGKTTGPRGHLKTIPSLPRCRSAEFASTVLKSFLFR